VKSNHVSALSDPVHRTIVCVDIEGFGNRRRTNSHQLSARAGLYRSVRQAFMRSGIRWDKCYHEDRGDGLFVLIPPDVPKNRLVARFPGELAAAVAEHNHQSAHQEARIRLRLAVHAGEVSYDGHGVTGAALNLAFRLLDAAPLKAALRRSPGVLALIASDWLFDEVVRHDETAAPRTYRRTRVALKETDTTAWFCLPDHPFPPIDEADLGTRPDCLAKTGWHDEERLEHAVRRLAQAVQKQWETEAETRSLYQPQPIRLNWCGRNQSMAASPAAVLGDAVGGRPLRLKLRGGLHDLVPMFERLPNRQLVVLGRPGAGKTVLAMLFTLDLLDHRRTHGGPIPVLLSLSSWNPRTEHLQTWLHRRLLEEYSELADTDPTGTDIAAQLINHGHIMPVLDGLDEMPPKLHSDAIAAIDRATGNGRSVVLTCRSTEYRAAVAAGGRVLSTAAVIELEPVGVPDVIAFLTAGSVSEDTRWLPIVAHLRAYPTGPLAQALSSPLIMALARAAYTSPASDPARLLNRARFADRSAIEYELLDSFIPASYTDHPAPPTAARSRTIRPYPVESAQRWLRFLARHLSEQNTPDLAWWRLHHAMPRLGKRLVGGLALGSVDGLVAGLATGIGAGPGGFAAGFMAGLVAGIVAACMGRPPRHPRQLNIRIRGRQRQLGRYLVAGLAVGAAAGIGVGVAVGIAGGLLAGARTGLVVGFAVGLTVVFAVGVASGLMAWLNGPADIYNAPSPSCVLRSDATASAVRMVFIVFGAALAVGLAVGTVGLDVGLVVWLLGGAAAGLAGGLLAGLAGGLARGLVATAWGWYLFSHCWLAVQGKLPWRFMAFLDDAHQRGVLRQSGEVYQFRHARLQQRLALRGDPANMETRPTRRFRAVIS
jgi:NACHT domain